LAVLLAALPACASPYPSHYSAEAIEAQIVDADTKKPIEGVIITANWQLFHSTIGGRVPGDQLMVMEAITGKDGRFNFPAWGPKLALSGYLDNRDPQFLLFKSGYEYRALQNPTLSTTDHSPVRRSAWNGKTIELKPFKGTQDEYAKVLGTLSLSWAYSGNECEWKMIPLMVLAAHKQAMSFKKQGIVTSLYTIDNLLPYEGYHDKCGAREYFKEYRP